MERGVGDDEELAAESEVLLVVGNELQVVAEVAVDVDGVLDVEAVEGDGILADGRGEGVLQQSHLVVVDVDIGEDVLHGDVEDVASLNEVIDAGGVDTAYDVLLVVRVAAVDVLADGFVDGDGQDELVVVGARLHLVEQPLALADEAAVDEFVGADVVHGQGNFLILVVLIVVVVLQVGLLLRGDDAAHELHGGVVLARVLAALLVDHDFLQLLGVGLQLHVEARGCLLADHDALRLIAHGREREVPAVVARNAIASVGIARHGHVVALVGGTGVEDGVAGLSIGDDATDLCLRGKRKGCEERYE